MGGGERTSPLVTRLAVVVFLQWVGSTSVLPLLPLYLRQKGATPATIGAVMAAYFVGSVVFQYVAGHVADRVGRRPVLIGGLLAYAGACLAFLLPLSPLAYGGLRFVQGAAAGSVEVATLATVALVVPAGERGRASARIYAGQFGGAAFGPLLGAFIGVHEMAYIFVFSAAVATIAALPVLRSDLGPTPPRERAALPAVSVDARLVGAVGVAVAYGLVIGSYEACWTLLMHAKGASSFQLGLSWTLFALPYVVCFRIGGWAADRFNRRWLAVVGIVNSAVFCAIYPLLAVDALLALCCFEAIGTSLALPAAQSVLTEGADARAVGRRQGVFSASQTGALAVSAAVAGALFESGPAVPFVTMAAASAVVAAVVPIAWRRVPGRVSVPEGASAPRR